MRKQLYEIVYNRTETSYSKAYSIVMFIAIVASVLPLMTRENHIYFKWLDIFACVIFCFDYLVKWVTYDLRLEKSGVTQFLRYPFTAWAIFDLLTILPTINIINRSLVSLRIIRLFKVLRMLRVFERSSHMSIIVNVIKSESRVLGNVLGLCVAYIFTTALIMFNHEESIESFLDALYWATTALTTVGYGDICPNSDSAKIISMVSSLFGIAIVALPSGIITARYLEELTKIKKS